MSDGTAAPVSTWHVLARLSRFARPHTGAIILAFVLLLGRAAADLLKPWPLKFLLDDVLTKDSLSGGTLYVLIGATALLVAVAVFDGLFTYFQASVVQRAGRTMVFNLRTALFDHVQRLSLQFHSRRETGDVMTRVTSDVKMLKDVATESAVEVVASSILLLGMAAVLLWLDWRLALVGIASSPALFFLLVRTTPKIREYSRTERKREGALATVLHESLGAVRLTRVFNMEDGTKSRFQEESEASLESGLAAKLTEERVSWGVDVVAAAVTAGVMAFGAWRVIDGALTPGELVVFVSYMRGFHKPLRKAIRDMSKIMQAMAKAERIVELLDTEEGVTDLPGARPAPRLKGPVTFDGVTFVYEGTTPALQEITCALPAGKVTAIVGPTGAGKSTLASLIPRLYDPTSGAVTIDGTDVREYTLASLRSQISMVPQETVLFRTTIGENIAYGHPGATLDEIVSAARAANAHEFIVALPDGYETEVGERGDTLSGGQRQRIAIARAMVRDAPILILDEPFSGLDASSAAVVESAIERLVRGRTAIVLTHLLASAARADWIIVLDRGRVVQQGSHQELRTKDGLYRRLIGSQPSESHPHPPWQDWQQQRRRLAGGFRP